MIIKRVKLKIGLPYVTSGLRDGRDLKVVSGGGEFKPGKLGNGSQVLNILSAFDRFWDKEKIATLLL